MADYSDFSIRTATPGDAPILRSLILELAEYEKLRDEAETNEADLAAHLAPDANPRCEALIAELENGDPAGFALFYHNYSTFKTNWGIYLEDLFVRPAHRGYGVGFALLREVAKIAVERKCVRVEWAVLDWNQLAIDFYRRIGADALDEWTTMRLSGQALLDLAGRPGQSGSDPPA